MPDYSKHPLVPEGARILNTQEEEKEATEKNRHPLNQEPGKKEVSPPYVPEILRGTPYEKEADKITELLYKKGNEGFDTSVSIDKGRVEHSLRTFFDTPAPVAAKVQRIANEKGMPFDAILRGKENWEEWDEAAKVYEQLFEVESDVYPPARKDNEGVSSIEDLEHKQYKFPGTVNWLRDPAKMAASKDSLESLTFAENLYKSYHAPFSEKAAIYLLNGYKGMVHSLGSVIEFQKERQEAERIKSGDILTEIPKEQQKRVKNIFGALQPSFRAMAAHQEYLGEDIRTSEALKQVQLENLSGVEQLALDFISTIPLTGTALALGAITTPAVGAAFVFGHIYNATYTDLRLNGVSHERATIASVGNAAAQSALELVPILLFAKALKTPGFKKSISRFVLEFGPAEFLTETVQAFPEEAARVFGEGELKGLTAKEQLSLFAQRIPETLRQGVKEGLTVLPYAGFGIGVKLMSSMANVRKYEQDREIYDEHIPSADSSKINERSPELYEDHGRNMIESLGAAANFYLGTDALEVFYQDSKKVDKAARELGIESQLEEARETGRDLEIPREKWVAWVKANPEVEAAVKDDIRFNVNGPNKKDLANIKEEMQEIVDAKKEELDKATIGAYTPKLFEAWREQLITPKKEGGAGFSAELAESEITIASAIVARLTDAHNATLPVNEQIDADEYLKRFPVNLGIKEKFVPRPAQEIQADIDGKGLTAEQIIDREVEALAEEVRTAEVEGGLLKEEKVSETAGRTTEVRGRFRASTFPKGFKDIGVSKKDFASVAASKKGPRYERIKAAAIERLKEAYGTGRVKADKAFLEAIDVKEDDIKFQRQRIEQSPLGFFSQLQETVESFDFKNIPSKDLANRITKAPGIKKEELEQTEVISWLELQDRKVSKEEVIEFLKEGGVQLEEVVREEGVVDIEDENLKERFLEHEKSNFDVVPGEEIKEEDIPDGNFVVVDASGEIRRDFGGDFVFYTSEEEAIDQIEFDINEEFDRLIPEDIADIMGEEVAGEKLATKFEDYTLPGGENYREVLMILPDKVFPKATFEKLPEGTEFTKLDETDFILTDSSTNVPVNLQGEEVASPIHYESRAQLDAELAGKPLEAEGTYKSAHWDEPNVLAHIRMNDRVNSEGKKTLLIEEIQSDWHQEARKKGFVTATKEELDTAIKRRDEIAKKVLAEGRTVDDLKGEELAEWEALFKTIEAGIEGVPDAPFKATEAWSLLAFKRALRLAVEENYDAIAWTPGDIQNDRYDLSKKVSEIVYFPENNSLRAFDLGGKQVIEETVPEDKIEDYIGKEPARKLLEAKEEKTKAGHARKTLSGQDLKVGGTGMIGFYDKLLPKTVGKYVKKLDKQAKVGVDKLQEKTFEVGGLIKRTKAEAEAQIKEDIEEAKTQITSFKVRIEKAEESVTTQDERIKLWEDRSQKIKGTTFKDFKKVQTALNRDRWEHKDIKFIGIEHNKKTDRVVIAIAGNLRGFDSFEEFKNADLEKSIRKLIHEKTRKGFIDRKKDYQEDIERFKKEIAEWEQDLKDSQEKGIGEGEPGAIQEIWHLPLTDKLKAEVLEGQTLFQAGPKDPKAAITFADTGAYIELFKKATPGSLSHEMSHLYENHLDQLIKNGMGGEQAKLDVAKIREFNKDNKEAFGTGFETYLLEGKAPSKEMANVFSRFRSWLMAIYTSIRDIGVPINEDIRAVYDRMLASEQEIEEAKQYYKGRKELHDLLPATPKQKEVLTKSKAEANRAALEEQTAKHLKAYWEAKEGGKGALKDLAEREYADSPLYKAVNDAIDFGGLNLAETQEDYGVSTIEALSKVSTKLVTKNGRASISELASKFNFESREAFLEEILKAESKKDFIDRRTQELIDKEEKIIMSKLTSTETVPGEESSHNDDSLEHLIKEDAFLTRQLPIQERRNQAKLERKIVKDEADARIKELPVKRAIRYDLFSKAEQKFADAALRAAEQGNVVQSQLAKRQQVLNHALVQAAIKARDLKIKIENSYKANKVKSKLQFKDGKPKVENSFAEAALNYIYHYKLSTSENIRPKNPEAIPNLQDLDEILFSLTPEWLIGKQLRGQNYKDLSMGELVQLDELIKGLYKSGSNETIALQDIGFKTIQEVNDASLKLMEDIPSRKVFNEFSKVGGILNKLSGVAYGAEMTSFRFDALDNDQFLKTGTPGPLKKVFNKVRDAEGQVFDTMQVPLKATEKTWEGIKKAVRRIEKENGSRKIVIDGVPMPAFMQRKGRTTWTGDRLVSYLLNMGNVHNLEVLRNSYGYTLEQEAAIVAKFTKEELNLVQEIWDATNLLWPQLKQVNFNMYNRNLESVEAQAITMIDKNGETVNLKGGYYPLVFDHLISDKASKFKEDDILKNSTTAVHRTTKPKDSFTFARKTKAHSLPPKLSLSVWFSHIKDTARYISMAEVMRDLNKITLNKEWKEAVEDKGGQTLEDANGREIVRGTYARIRDWVQYVARPDRRMKGFLGEGMLDKQRKLATVAILGANFGVGVKQRLSMFSAARAIGWRWIANGYRHADLSSSVLGLRNTESWQKVLSLSPYMRARNGNVSREITDIVSTFKPLEKSLNVLGKEITLRDIQDFMFEWIQMNDRATVGVVWQGAFNKKIDTLSNSKLTNTEKTREAVSFADSIVQDTQPSSLAIDLNDFQRAEGFMRFMTPFMTWTFKFGNILRAQNRAWKRGNISTKEYSRHVMYELMLAPWGAAIISSMVAQGELPEWWEYGSAPAENAISWVPLLRDVPGSIKFRKSLGTATAFEGGTRIVKAAKSGVLTISNDKDFNDFLWDFGSAMEFQFGIPALKVHRNIKKTMKNIEGDI